MCGDEHMRADVHSVLPALLAWCPTGTLQSGCRCTLTLNQDRENSFLFVFENFESSEDVLVSHSRVC